MHESEGVIKFSCEHEQQALRGSMYASLANELEAWRKILVQCQLIGQDPARYDGAGFGNLSGRLMPPSLPRGRRQFLISGTQTGGLAQLGLEGLCKVSSYQLCSNRVESMGLVLPSSESLTHAAIYDVSPAIRFVFHVHSPVIWKHAHARRMAVTAASVGYGTPEMAQEVQRMYLSTGLAERRVLAMGGHQDGVIGFGYHARDAGLAILDELAEANKLS